MIQVKVNFFQDVGSLWPPKLLLVGGHKLEFRCLRLRALNFPMPLGELANFLKPLREVKMGRPFVLPNTHGLKVCFSRLRRANFEKIQRLKSHLARTFPRAEKLSQTAGIVDSFHGTQKPFKNFFGEQKNRSMGSTQEAKKNERGM